MNIIFTMSKKCPAIVSKKGTVCNSLIMIGQEYCNPHDYFTSLSEDFMAKIKNGDDSIDICFSCRHWHNDINPETGKLFAVCNLCKQDKKAKKIENSCDWCVIFKPDSEYMIMVDTIKNKNLYLTSSQQQKIPRLFGNTNFPKCPNPKKPKSNFCLSHDFAKAYTNEEKSKVSNCKSCDRIKLLVEGKEVCDVCHNKMIKNNSKKQAIMLSNRNPCIAIICGNPCRNNKVDGDYCACHAFIPERTIENIELGNMMCLINNITEVFTEMISCTNCGILFLYGTSITENGAKSEKCPYCIIHLREYEAQRDRKGRNYTKKMLETKIIYKQNNYEKFTGYWIKSRGNKILRIGVDEYHRQNNEYMKQRRKLFPDKQKAINNLQNINMKYRYGYYKREAIDKGRIFELSYEECKLFFLSNCFYCNDEAIEGKILNGIDRSDNTIGYVLNNCVPSCSMCNIMKGFRLNHIEFLLACNHIMSNLGVIKGLYSPLIFKNSLSCGYDRYESNANRRGYNFEISEDEFYMIISNNCYLCGKQTNNSHINGIDRLDNNIGYILNNCRTCCSSCNYLKNKYNMNDVLEKLLKICNNYYDNIKIIKNMNEVVCSIENIKYNAPIVNTKNINFNDNNDVDTVDLQEFSDSKYLNELEILLDTNESIDNIIDTLDEEYKTHFKNIMTEQNNPLSERKFEGVGKKKKLAIKNKKEQKIINAPINNEKLIEKNTNPEIINTRISDLKLKKENKGQINNDSDTTIITNYNNIMKTHKDNVYSKLREHYILYNKSINKNKI
jgi:hypothetical protein